MENLWSHCYFLIDETFIPFGVEAGDNETAVVGDNLVSLGPLTLSTPLVFFLQKEHQIFVSKYR